jgi:hypothetical protein
MTPEQFKQEMQNIVDEDECIEETHRLMDYLLCDVLENLGYSEGVQIFKQTYKWYS